MNTSLTSARSLFDFDWEAFMRSIGQYGFETICPKVPDSIAHPTSEHSASINLIAAHPTLKLVLHARSIPEHTDSYGYCHGPKIGTAEVYGMARARDGLGETIRSTLSHHTSMPTAIQSCRSFQLSARTGLSGIDRLHAKLDFIDWFEWLPVNTFSYADTVKYGGVPPHTRRVRGAQRAFFAAAPQWVRDFTIPYQ